MRRAQISTYIILGVAISLLVMLSVIFTTQETQVRVPTASALSSDRLYVEECLEHAGDAALLQNGREGGLDLSTQHRAANHDVAVHLHENDIKVPTNPTITFYLEQKGEELFLDCLSELPQFETTGNLDITIQERSVVFSLASPVNINSGETVDTISTMAHEAGPVRINRLYDMSYYIAQLQTENPDELCLTCLHELTEDHFVWIDIMQHDDGLVTYNITDLFSRIGNEPYVLVVGHEV